MTPENLLENINADIQKAEDFKARYISVYKDILQGLNLERHLQEIEGEIIDLNKLIVDTEAKGGETSAFIEIREEFFRLVYEIKERL